MTEALSPAEWLAMAAEELAVARALTGAPGGLTEAICFHSQQCAEKALKAVYVRFADRLPPRLHALEELLRQIEMAGGTIAGAPAGLKFMTPYATTLRYETPGSATPEQAREALALAAAAMAWAEAPCAFAGPTGA
ncbi:MAG: HEPN domain-containing protein [Terriglobales bacterium]